MFGLPFPTYLGWILGPGIMVATFVFCVCKYNGYLKKTEYSDQSAQEDEKGGKA